MVGIAYERLDEWIADHLHKRRQRRPKPAKPEDQHRPETGWGHELPTSLVRRRPGQVTPWAGLHWWHRVTSIWTIGSWAFLAIFVIRWDLQGWTGQMIKAGSVLGLVVWLGFMAVLFRNYIAEHRGQLTPGAWMPIIFCAALIFGPVVFVGVNWMGHALRWW